MHVHLALGKNIFIEYFKREGFEFMKNFLTSPYEKLISAQFKKNEFFDKEAITFIKKMEQGIQKKL